MLDKRFLPLMTVVTALIPRFSVSLSSSSSKPTVAVIGGGISGLSAASKLCDGFDVTVFDTGRLRPGGRCSSRMVGDSPKEDDPAFPCLSRFVFDHAAQVITVPSGKMFSDFGKQVEEWEDQGILKAFPPDTLFRIQSATSAEEVQTPSYYAPNGMGSIALSMAKDRRFEVKQDVWVSPSNGLRYLSSSSRWRLQASGRRLGEFDHLVVAHNGKCADRIMSKTPAKDVHSLLRVNFAATVPAHGGKRMTLNSIYSLTFALPTGSVLSKALPPNYMCGFIENARELRFLTCQSNKFPNDEAMEVWTILSSASFAKRHKAAQEFLTDETIDTVTALLLQALEKFFELPSTSISSAVVERRLQLWGAALPLNVWKNNLGFVYDADYKVGVCGDWLVKPSIAGAWTSGRRLAEYMVEDGSRTVGLQGSFQRSESAFKAGIGALVQAT